jgi:Ribosomal protein L3
MYRVAFSGQMGYHQRTEYNKQIVQISDDGAALNPGTGFHKYGAVKNSYILLKGSVMGARKRLVKFIPATRQGKNKEAEIAVEVVR